MNSRMAIAFVALLLAANVRAAAADASKTGSFWEHRDVAHGRILREYADLAVPICVSYDEESSRDQLRARAHKLKGSAGMIGATKVMRFAGAAEEALQENRPVEAVQRVLNYLAAALTTLREEAELLLHSQPPADAVSAEVARPLPIGIADIDGLYVLLKSQNLAAVDRVNELAASLREILGAPRFDRLREALLDKRSAAGAASRSPAPG